MKLNTHLVLQLLGFVINGGTVLTGIVPPKWKPYVVLAVTAAQGALAWYNHFFNPDGTPAQVAYKPSN